jgi:hypothetical protein
MAWQSAPMPMPNVDTMSELAPGDELEGANWEHGL